MAKDSPSGHTGKPAADDFINTASEEAYSGAPVVDSCRRGE
jgi:hypothetical protein